MDEDAAEGLLDFFKEKPTLLRKRLAHADPVLLSIVDDDGAVVTCKAIKIYSTRHARHTPYPAEAFQVTKASGAWGNVPLGKSGATALAFIAGSETGGLYREYPLRGHFAVENVAGTVCAVAHFHLLDEKECGLWEPSYLREAAFLPDPSRPGRVALPYALLERHLLEELALLDNADDSDAKNMGRQ